MRKCGVLLLAIIIQGCVYGQPNGAERLKPKAHYGQEAMLTVQILDTYHFRKINFDDSLSRVVLQEYIAALDNNKTYFTQGDIQEFQVYADQLDDLTRSADVSPAFEIYERFRKRFYERMDYLTEHLVNYPFDYSIDEYYHSDRSDVDYAANEEELNEIWRKIIKNQTLSLKLNGKADSVIGKTVVERYDRFKKAISQYKPSDVFEIYLNTVAEAYDPHTNYFSPRTSDRFQQNMKLSLEGIGARLQTDNDFTKVVEVIPGGPAMKSDLIHPDDRIVAVAQGVEGDMVDVIGWRIDDVVELIKGPKGTTVRLQILPAEEGIYGKTKEITLVRDKVKLEDQKAKAEVIPVIRNGIKYNFGVITLPSFYMDFDAYLAGDPNYTSTTRDVKKLIEELKTQSIDGLMIDLRNNGGGSLAEAVDLTGLFIKDGPVVQVKNPMNKVEVQKDEDKDISYDGPITVLINRFSASASEIFAGAIQDYGRGIVVGETSFGKGTVQSVIDLGRYLKLDDDEKAGQLKLTLQKFYRVTGSSTQHLGVSPDIKFPSAFSAEEFGESSWASALPWDKIKGTNYDAVELVSPKIRKDIADAHERRLNDDVFMKQLLEETNEIKKNISKTDISLNENIRKKEQEESEQNRLNNSSLSSSELNKEGIYEVEKIDVDDKYLREGLVILSDMVSAIG